MQSRISWNPMRGKGKVYDPWNKGNKNKVFLSFLFHFTSGSDHKRPEEASEPLVEFGGVSKQQEERSEELQHGNRHESCRRGRREAHKRHEGENLKWQENKEREKLQKSCLFIVFSPKLSAISDGKKNTVDVTLQSRRPWRVVMQPAQLRLFTGPTPKLLFCMNDLNIQICAHKSQVLKMFAFEARFREQSTRIISVSFGDWKRWARPCLSICLNLNELLEADGKFLFLKPTEK